MSWAITVPESKLTIKQCCSCRQLIVRPFWAFWNSTSMYVCSLLYCACLVQSAFLAISAHQKTLHTGMILWGTGHFWSILGFIFMSCHFPFLTRTITGNCSANSKYPAWFCIDKNLYNKLIRTQMIRIKNKLIMFISGLVSFKSLLWHIRVG